MIERLIITLVSPRFICVMSIFLWVYFLYDLASVQKEPPGRAPYPFLFVSAIAGNLVGLYLIENYNEKYEMYVGYFGLYIFLIVAVGGVFFNW